MKPKLRTSSSIVPFREKAEKIWKLERYKFPQDIFKPAVFFGMYHIADYAYYVFHRGKKTILWAGSDIQTLVKSKFPWHELFTGREHYVENKLEQAELVLLGIDCLVRPSFLEDINDFPVSFKPTERPQVFLTGHPGREDEYGFNIVMKIAQRVPEVDFHFYGSNFHIDEIVPHYENLYYHGRVPSKQFNEEIKNYHCGLRLNEHDGFSEILAKSVLMGQYPISRINYPHIWHYETEEELIRQLKRLKKQTKPNLEARDFWRGNVNNYPWIGTTLTDKDLIRAIKSL